MRETKKLNDDQSIKLIGIKKIEMKKICIDENFEKK